MITLNKQKDSLNYGKIDYSTTANNETTVNVISRFEKENLC